MKEKLRRSKRRHMAGAQGTLVAELGVCGENGREGTHSKNGTGEGASASQSVAPSSPGADANKPSTSSPARSSGSGSPEPNCAICLGKLENKSFTDSCFHMFCFVCLLEWSKVKPECPLCKQKFKSIIHNVRSYDDYQQYHLDRQPETQQHSWENPDGRRFRYRTTMTLGPFQGVLDLIHTYPNHPSFTVGSGPNPVRDCPLPEATVSRPGYFYNTLRENSTSTQDWPLALTTSQTTRQNWRNRRCNATSEFRKRVYSEHLRLVKVGSDVNRYRMVSPEFFESNPGATHRLIPWLNRELNALLSAENHSQFVLELIMGLINRFSIQSEEFYQHLQPFLGRNTRHFMEEFYTFARSPYNMVAYDTKAVYRAALEEISDSDSSVEQEEVIVVDSSSSDEDDQGTRAPTRWPTLGDLSEPLDRTVSNMLAQSSWDSPTPGPSWDSSPERQGTSQPRIATSTHTTTTVSAPHVSWSVGTSSMSSAGVKSESPIAHSSDSESDSSSMESETDDDVIVVATEKPWQERSPIVLSSADERSAAPKRESKESLSAKLKIKKQHSRRERDAERSHQSRRHSSDHHGLWRMWSSSRSRSRSPAVSSNRHGQDDHQSRSRTSHHCHEVLAAHNSRSSQSQETLSQGTHSRSRSRESRNRDHRRSHSQQSSHSKKSSRKRHRTHSSGAGSRGNSVEVNSVKKKKSKHKKRKKHKKHGKHKHKKKDGKHSRRNRSRKSGEPAVASAVVAISSFSHPPAAATAESSSAAWKKHPSGHKASSDSADSAWYSRAGAALEVAMEIAVGSTSQNESSLDDNADIPAVVIAISSDEEDDDVDVVGDVEQQPCLTERTSPTLPFCPEDLAMRAMRRYSWNNPSNTDLDGARSGLFSLLRQPVPPAALTRADPLLSSSGVTTSDSLLSPGASSPPPLSGPFYGEVNRASGRSTWGSLPESIEEPESSTTTASRPSSHANQDLRYGYIDERTFPSRSSMQPGGPTETGSAVGNGSKPDPTCVSSSGTAAVDLPKWTSSRMKWTPPWMTLSTSSAPCSFSMMASASSMVADSTNSQVSSDGSMVQGNADNSASDASCTASPEASSLTGSRGGRGTTLASAYLNMLERSVLGQYDDENSGNASSRDESSCESQEGFFADAVHTRRRPLDDSANAPFTPKSPEIISSDDEDHQVSTEHQPMEPSQPLEEIDVCETGGDPEDEEFGTNGTNLSDDESSQAASYQAQYGSGQAREEISVDTNESASGYEEDEDQGSHEGQSMENMNEDQSLSSLDDHFSQEEEKLDTNVCPDRDNSENGEDTGDCSDGEEQNSPTVEGGDVSGSERSFDDCSDKEEQDGENVENEEELVSGTSDRESTVHSPVDSTAFFETEKEEDASARNDLHEDDSEDDKGSDSANEDPEWSASSAAEKDQYRSQGYSSSEDSS